MFPIIKQINPSCFKYINIPHRSESPFEESDDIAE